MKIGFKLTTSEKVLNVIVPPSTGSSADGSASGSVVFSGVVLFSVGVGVLEAVLLVLQPVNKIPTRDKISKRDHKLLFLATMCVDSSLFNEVENMQFRLVSLSSGSVFQSPPLSSSVTSNRAYSLE
ncbi:hypothetical protein D3C74_317090 [compost metagenome]